MYHDGCFKVFHFFLFVHYVYWLAVDATKLMLITSVLTVNTNKYGKCDCNPTKQYYFISPYFWNWNFFFRSWMTPRRAYNVIRTPHIKFHESLMLFSDRWYGPLLVWSSHQQVENNLNNVGECKIVALDVSETFYRVWHQVLLSKIGIWDIDAGSVD